jgi:hypothetical protein
MRRLALVASLAVLAAGCGGGGDGTSASADDIARAATKSTKKGSLEADFAISGQGLTGRGSGVFNTGKTRSGQLQMTVTANGRDTPVDTIVSGDVFYMRSPAFARAVGQGKQWIKLDLGTIAKRGANLGGLLDASPTPTNALAYLEGTTDVKKVGSEKVGGVATTHYTVNADLRRAVERASGTARSSLQQVIAQTGIRKLPLDVWLDQNGYIRKVKYDEHSGRRQAAHVAIELHDFGAPVPITPPPSDSVVDLLQRLQQGA